MVDRGRPEYQRFREVLRAIRRERGLSQEALAERLGVRQTWVSLYEVGERRLDAVEISDIARALGVSVASIFERAGLD